MRSRTAIFVLTAMFLISVAYTAQVYGDEVDNPYNFTIVVEYNTGGIRDIIAAYMSQNLAPIGIQVELDGGPWYRVVGDYLAGTMPYDMMILGITGGGPNPDNAFMAHTDPAYGYLAQILIGNNGTESYLHGGAPLDVIERMDELLATWPTIFDAQEKTEMVIEWQNLYTDYALGYYPIYYPRSFTCIPATFGPYDPNEGVLGSILMGADWSTGGNTGGGTDDEFTYDIGTSAGWNPYTTADSSSSTVYNYLFDTLVAVDGDYTLQPRIATNWTVTDDWEHWEFYIPSPDNPDDVTDDLITYFCDPAAPTVTDHPVTADDVLFTLDVCISSVGALGNHNGSWTYAGLSDYGYVDPGNDPNWIYFDFKYPDSDLPLAFSFEVIPKYILDDGAGDPWGYPGGAWVDFEHIGPASGLFYVDDYVLGSGGYVTLLQNPLYKARPASMQGAAMLTPMDHELDNVYNVALDDIGIDKVNLLMIEDQEVTWTKFLTGEIDIRGLADRGRSEIDVKRADPTYEVYERTATGFGFIGFSLMSENLADIQLREAICYLLDPEDINEAAFDGLYTNAYSYVSAFIAERTGDQYTLANGTSVVQETLYKYKWDWEAAKGIMQDLGYDTTPTFIHDQPTTAPGLNTVTNVVEELISGPGAWAAFALSALIAGVAMKKRRRK